MEMRMQNGLELSVKKNKLFTSIKLSKAFPSGIRGTVFNLEVGEVLFKQKDPNKMVYLLLFGEMNLIRRENRKTDYIDLHPGDFFSNYKILDEPYLYTTAVALKESKLLGIYKNDFDEILTQNEDIKSNVIKYFNGEFDIKKTEDKVDSDLPVKEKKKNKPRFEIINTLESELLGSDQEKEILNKEAELNKIRNLLDTRISDIKENYESDKKLRFKKISTLGSSDEFLKRESVVNEFNKVIKKKESELEKKQELLKQKAEKQKAKVEKQKEKLIEIEKKLKKEITLSEKKVKLRLAEYQEKEIIIQNLENKMQKRELEINQLIKQAESQAIEEKEKTQKQIVEMQEKEKALLKDKQQTEDEFVNLRDEFSKKERELLEKSKELENKEKDIITRISNIRNETLTEREKLLAEKEKVLQLEAALLRKEEKLKKEKEILKSKELRITNEKKSESELDKELTQINEFLDRKLDFETKIVPRNTSSDFIDPSEFEDFPAEIIVNVDEPDHSLSKSMSKIEAKELSSIKQKNESEKRVEPKIETPEEKIVKSDSEKLLHLSVNRDLKQMFSSVEFKETRIIFVNIKKATFSDAITFKNFVSKIIEKGFTDIIIDFNYCSYIDSTFLGAILTTLKKIRSRDGSLKLVISEEVRSSLIMLTQADQLFKVYDNLSEAFHSK